MQNAVAKLQPGNQQQVEKFLTELLQKTGIPGISVAMNVNGDTLQAAAGTMAVGSNQPMTAESLFELGCINKLLVAIVVLELSAKGLINLDETISSYLPELEGVNGNQIKVRHLLCHSAGYQGENMDDPDIEQDYSWGEFARTFNSRPMLFEPGTLFDYSHSSSVILTRIAETLTNRSMQSWMDALVFKPLGIQVVGNKDVDPAVCISGHRIHPVLKQLHPVQPNEWCEFWSWSVGGPWITLRDLARLGRAIIQDASLFSAETRKLLFEHAVQLPAQFTGSSAEQPYFIYGLGCARFPTGTYGVRSKSRGQCCALRFCSATGIVVAAGINIEAPFHRDFVINKLFNSMMPEDATAVPSLVPEPSTSFALEELVGTYQGVQNHSLKLLLENGALVMTQNHNAARNNDKSAIAIVSKRDDGQIQPLGKNMPLSFGFVRNSKTTEINLVMGESFYKRM